MQILDWFISHHVISALHSLAKTSHDHLVCRRLTFDLHSTPDRKSIATATCLLARVVPPSTMHSIKNPRTAAIMINITRTRVTLLTWVMMETGSSQRSALWRHFVDVWSNVVFILWLALLLSSGWCWGDLLACLCDIEKVGPVVDIEREL